jgi:hypothetical protein
LHFGAIKRIGALSVLPLSAIDFLSTLSKNSILLLL